MNGSVTVDIIDELFAMTVKGPLIPGWELVVAGKQVFNIPGGVFCLLGPAIVDAILDLIS
jgi:hypothetical protein